MSNTSANLILEQMQLLMQHHANQANLNAPAPTGTPQQSLAQFQMSQMAQQAQLAAAAAAASSLFIPGMKMPTMPLFAGFSEPSITGASIVGIAPTIFKKLSDGDIDILANAIHLEEGNKNLDEIFRDLAAVTTHNPEDLAAYFLKNSKDIRARIRAIHERVSGRSTIKRKPIRSDKKLTEFQPLQENGQTKNAHHNGQQRRSSRRIPAASNVNDTPSLSSVIDDDESNAESDISPEVQTGRKLRPMSRAEQKSTKDESSDEEAPTPEMLESRRRGHKTYFPEEMRALGKFMAKVGLYEWDQKRQSDNIRMFCSNEAASLQERDHPERSESAWRVFYRRHEIELREMAERYEIRAAAHAVVSSREIPDQSEASSSRKRVAGDSNAGSMDHKRRRGLVNHAGS